MCEFVRNSEMFEILNGSWKNCIDRERDVVQAGALAGLVSAVVSNPADVPCHSLSFTDSLRLSRYQIVLLEESYALNTHYTSLYIIIHIILLFQWDKEHGKFREHLTFSVLRLSLLRSLQEVKTQAQTAQRRFVDRIRDALRLWDLPSNIWITSSWSTGVCKT